MVDTSYQKIKIVIMLILLIVGVVFGAMLLNKVDTIIILLSDYVFKI